MPSFGEKLKQERVKRSITLEQISLSTKIGTRMLQALEEEKFNQLPGGIFNKGFVRAYARHIGLDEDQAIADYLEASGETLPPKPGPGVEPEAPPFESRPASSSKPFPWGLLAALLLLVALVLSVWSRRQQAPDRPPAAPATQKPVGITSPALSQSPSSIAPSEGATAEAGQLPKNPEASSAPAPLPASAAARVPAPVRAAAGTAPPSVQPGEFTVVVLAREDSWLSITADGKTTFSDTLAAGNQRAIHARNQVLLRSGNTGALDFVFNGQKLSPQGNFGEVKTLTFGASGLQPTPLPSSPIQ